MRMRERERERERERQRERRIAIIRRILSVKHLENNNQHQVSKHGASTSRVDHF